MHNSTTTSKGKLGIVREPAFLRSTTPRYLHSNRDFTSVSKPVTMDPEHIRKTGHVLQAR